MTDKRAHFPQADKDIVYPLRPEPDPASSGTGWMVVDATGAPICDEVSKVEPSIRKGIYTGYSRTGAALAAERLNGRAIP